MRGLFQSWEQSTVLGNHRLVQYPRAPYGRASINPLSEGPGEGAVMGIWGRTSLWRGWPSDRGGGRPLVLSREGDRGINNLALHPSSHLLPGLTFPNPTGSQGTQEPADVVHTKAICLPWPRAALNGRHLAHGLSSMCPNYTPERCLVTVSWWVLFCKSIGLRSQPLRY